MKYKYLAIALFAGISFANAQTINSFSNTEMSAMAVVTAGQQTNDIAAANDEPVDMPKPLLPFAPYGGSGRKTTFFGSYELGYVHSTSEKAGVKGSGYGFSFKIEYGLKFVLPTNSEAKYNFLSGSLFYTNFYTGEHSTVAGMESKTKYTTTMIGLPLSYCSISNNQNTGYFWQVGVNIASPGVKIDNRNGIEGFNKLYIEPSIYGGFSFWVERKRGVGAILLGPYVSYGVTNYANDNGASMHILAAGIKYTGVVL
jgi:hypothetical protein